MVSRTPRTFEQHHKYDTTTLAAVYEIPDTCDRLSRVISRRINPKTFIHIPEYIPFPVCKQNEKLSVAEIILSREISR